MPSINAASVTCCDVVACSAITAVRLPGWIADALQRALDVRNRYTAGAISAHAVAVARGIYSITYWTCSPAPA